MKNNIHVPVTTNQYINAIALLNIDESNALFSSDHLPVTIIHPTKISHLGIQKSALLMDHHSSDVAGFGPFSTFTLW